jgi:hypothetical protein
MNEKKVVEEKIPWIPLIVLTAFLSFLAMFTWRVLTPLGGNWQCFNNFGATRVTLIPIYPYLLLLLAYPLRRLFRATQSLLLYLYLVGLVASYTLGAGYLDFCVTLTRIRLYDTLGILEGVWWEPSVEAVAAMVRGGVLTNWMEWGPIVFVMSLLHISFWFFTSSIALIFRRSWIEIDKMPFPVVITGYEVLKTVHAERKNRDQHRALFLIGFILGLAFMVPVFMTRTFPWFPDIYGWRIVGGCPSGVVRSQEGDILGSTLVWYSGYSKNPVFVAIFLLAPVNVSFNVWFWSLVILILEQIAYYMGFYTGALSLSGAAKLCCPDGVATTAPFYWPILSMAGGYLAITIMYLFQHRSYIVETVKLALHGNSGLEKNEAMSYRAMYIMLIVSAVVSIVSLTIFGINLLAAFIILLISCFTTWFTLTIIWGTTGFGDSERLMWVAGFLRIVWPDPSVAPANLDYVMSHFWAQIGACIPTYGFGNGFFETAHALKMADLTGISNKKVFLLTAVCMVVAVPVFYATSVWTANLYGNKVTVAGWGTCSPGVDYFCETSPASQAARPSVSIYATYIIIGFLWTALLSVLHARFIWFPLDPIGFVIAASWSSMWQEIWSVFLAAWIIKTIVLKIGGSVLYEKYVIPTVGGFIGGTVLVTTIGVVVGVIKFYVPF